jgi:hypothetical protein
VKFESRKFEGVRPVTMNIARLHWMETDLVPDMALDLARPWMSNGRFGDTYTYLPTYQPTYLPGTGTDAPTSGKGAKWKQDILSFFFRSHDLTSMGLGVYLRALLLVPYVSLSLSTMFRPGGEGGLGRGPRTRTRTRT